MPHRSMRPHTPPSAPRLRVMHVASGGFSGATQVALDLTLGGQAHHETLLVLRHKRRTPMARVQALREQGVPLELVTGWTHWASIRALKAVCERWKPDIVVGHGFPEHLLARWAAKGAGVPVLVQVEHNMRERYTAFKRWQVARLAPHTQVFVGVSDAVSDVLRAMGLPADRVRTIRNGTNLQPYAESESHPYAQREPAIFMAARFGAQKDHETLIRSLVPLREAHGLQPKLRLAGGGSDRHRQRCVALVKSLGLENQVEFLGHRHDVPQLLMQHQVAALSTHYEGLPLSLAEAMAAGCAVVGSDVTAVRETLGDGQWGCLPQAAHPAAWAQALAELMGNPEAAAQRASEARDHARVELSRERMVRDYVTLFEGLTGRADSWPLRAEASAAGPADKPWLSMLIPAHNAGPYLAEALESVSSQLDSGAELIVFDDGSTDQTAQVLAQWVERLNGQVPALSRPMFRVLRSESGASVGVSAARNALLGAARGEWLWFLDADDRLRPGAVAQVQAVLARQPGLQAVVVDHAVWRASPRLKHRLRGEFHRRSLPFEDGAVKGGPALMHGLMTCGQWHVWGKVVRADAWPVDLRFPVGRVFEDLSVVPRLMAGIQRAWYLREPLIDYRSNPGSILGSMSAAKVRDWAQALDDLSHAPEFDAAWADFAAQQALRMAKVGQRLGAPVPKDWWGALCAKQPLVQHAVGAWRQQPRRWAAWWQARQLGWLVAGQGSAVPPASGGN